MYDVTPNSARNTGYLAAVSDLMVLGNCGCLDTLIHLKGMKSSWEYQSRIGIESFLRLSYNLSTRFYSIY